MDLFSCIALEVPVNNDSYLHDFDPTQDVFEQVFETIKSRNRSGYKGDWLTEGEFKVGGVGVYSDNWLSLEIVWPNGKHLLSQPFRLTSYEDILAEIDDVHKRNEELIAEIKRCNPETKAGRDKMGEKLKFIKWNEAEIEVIKERWRPYGLFTRGSANRKPKS